MKSLEKNLERATKMAEQTGGGILVISEGVFGMRGEQGKLKEIVQLKNKFKFRLLVDDAHGFGTLGKTGAGTGEIEIIGSWVVPEFGAIAGLVLAVAIISIIVLSAKTRMNIIPKI